jgi:hypothetical protein
MAALAENGGSRYFVRQQIMDAVNYVAARLCENPRLDGELEFLAKVLIRLNQSADPESAVVFIWFC